MEIRYHIKPKKTEEKVFIIKLDDETMGLANSAPADLPSWTRLEYHKCDHCPLSEQAQPHCPLAVHLVDLLEFGQQLSSHDEVDLRVVTQQRTVSKASTAQEAMSSMMGIIAASSGCPYTHFFRPLVRFHLPLSDNEETFFRVVSIYLISQYYADERGETVDFSLENLEKKYKEIHKLNLFMAKRLKGIGKEESVINALVKLDVYSLTLPRKMKTLIKAMEKFFPPTVDASSG